jgi:hypothetical protein
MELQVVPLSVRTLHYTDPNLKSKIIQILKFSEHRPHTKLENSTPDLVRKKGHSKNKGALKFYIKLYSGCVYKVYMKPKLIFHLELCLIHMIYHYEYANIPKSKKSEI